MTVYVKELLSAIARRYGKLNPTDLAEKLFEIGIVDHTLCKVLAVREYVAGQMDKGQRKMDAMWMASEKFCCTYEYVRKCMYYYTDINFK